MRRKEEVGLDVVAGVISASLGAFVLCLCVLGRGNIYGIGLFVFFASILYLIFRKKIHESAVLFDFQVADYIKSLNHIIFIVSITLSIWLLWSSLYHRPLTYFILTSIACGSIAAEILYSEKKKHTWIILFKIIIVAISIHAGIYYEFSGIYGSDPWYHTTLIQEIYNSGYIPKTVVYRPNHYYSLPLFHIEATITQLITSLSPYKSVFASIGFLEVAITVFTVFLIGQLVVNTKLGLLAALVICVTNEHIVRGTAIIPMTLGFCYFLLILYSIFYEYKNPTLSKVLFIVFSILLILTHTLASLAGLSLLVGIYIGLHIYNHLITVNLSENTRQKVSIGIASINFFAIALIAYWMYSFYNPGSGETFLECGLNTFSNAMNVDTKCAITTEAPTITTSIFDSVLNRLGYCMLLGGGIIGACTWLFPKERNRYRIVLLCAIVIFMMLVVPASIFYLIWLNVDRAYVFFYALLSIMSVQGLISIVRIIRSHRLQFCAIVSIIIIFSFLMLTNTQVSSDGPWNANKNTRRAGFTSSEYAAIGRVVDMSNGYFKTDGHYSEPVPYLFGKDIYKNMTAPAEKKDMFVLRDYCFKIPDLRQRLMEDINDSANFSWSAQITKSEYIEIIGGNRGNEVYDNGNVWAYVNLKNLDMAK